MMRRAGLSKIRNNSKETIFFILRQRTEAFQYIHLNSPGIAEGDILHKYVFPIVGGKNMQIR